MCVAYCGPGQPCCHPGLLTSTAPPYLAGQFEGGRAYRDWLNSTRYCPDCGAQVAERDL